MRRLAAFLAFALLVAGIVPSAQAVNVLVSGNSMNQSDAELAGNLAKLPHAFTFVSTTEFAGTSLAAYKAVWLDGFSNYPGLSAAALTTFMTSGGIVLVQSPGFGSQPLSQYPFGAELSAVYTYPPGYDGVAVQNASHPINVGLTDALLSGWGPSAVGHFSTAGSFTVLSGNGTAGQHVTLARTVGLGLLVYTQQGISERLSAADRAFTGGQIQLLNGVLARSGPCTPDATTLCLDHQPGDRRFRLLAQWSTVQGGGSAGLARAISLTPLGVDEGGLFWFFEATNPELLVKVLRTGCGTNGYFWLFTSAGTNVGLTTIVQDTQTGAMLSYTNPDISPAPVIQNVQAFPCN